MLSWALAHEVQTSSEVCHKHSVTSATIKVASADGGVFSPPTGVFTLATSWANPPDLALTKKRGVLNYNFSDHSLKHEPQYL